MKKFIAVVILMVAVAATACGCSTNGAAGETRYLRIHIRANSNDDIDQSVKYEIKDRVSEVMTPYLSKVESWEEAYAAVGSRLELIESTADQVLESEGFAYRAKAKLCREEFPTRTYDGLTLESGVYDALIVELGRAAGDNWWCVVFPPLCFSPSGKDGKVVYKSLIKELYEKYLR